MTSEKGNKNTVHAPGGPAYIFGKKNTAYKGPEAANEGEIDASASAAVGDLSTESEPEESPYSAAMIRSNDTRDFSHLQKADRVKAIQEEIIEGMGNIAVDEEEFNKYIEFVRSGYNYSFRNQVALMMQKPNGSNFKTYKQWQALGYQVAKGAKSAYVLRPFFKKIKVDDDGGNNDSNDSGDDKDQETISIPTGYTNYAVFSENDLDASVKKPPTHPLSEHIQRHRNNPNISDNQAMREDLMNVAKSMDIPVNVKTPEEDPSLGLTTGGYARKTPNGGYEIVLNGSFQDHSQTATLAHEMGHILCGHLDSDEKRNYGVHHDRANIEVEAETVSYAISRDYGLDSGNKAFAYLKSWSKGDEDKISSAMGTAAKATRSYYEKLEKAVTGSNQSEDNEKANEIAQEKSAERKKNAPKKASKKTTRKRTTRTKKK